MKHLIKLLLVSIIALMAIGIVSGEQILVMQDEKTYTREMTQSDMDYAKSNGLKIVQKLGVIPGVIYEVETSNKMLSIKSSNVFIDVKAVFALYPEEYNWGHNHTNAYNQKMTSGTNGSGIKIAVLDSGINYNHLDLTSSYCGGYDCVNEDNYPLDDFGHGTRVAGIIFPDLNDIEVVGIAPESDMYSVKILDNDGSGYVLDLLQGIQWACDNNMDVIHVSAGLYENYNYIESAVNNAIYNQNIYFVAAAGNDGTVLYPAEYDPVLSINALDNIDPTTLYEIAHAHGDIDFAAPGAWCLTTSMSGGRTMSGGTSIAAPHVTGILTGVLHVLQVDRVNTGGPSLADNQSFVIEKLALSSIDLGPIGKDTDFGYGEIQGLTWQLYDDNNDLNINKSEVITAQKDYLLYQTIEKSLCVEVFKKYFGLL